MAEERNAAGDTVTKRFFHQGFQTFNVQLSTFDSFFYTRDHLGSIRELTDNTGTVVARYDYTPYGIRTPVSVTDIADFGFTGHYFHQPTGLHLALYRAYDAETGRWLSRDRLGEMSSLANDVSLSLYIYARNDPINFADPFGLASGTLNKATEKVGGVWAVGTWDAYQAAAGSDRDFAVDVSVQLTKDFKGTGEEKERLKNAIRHSAWQAKLTMKHGAAQAQEVGRLHEFGEESSQDSFY